MFSLLLQTNVTWSAKTGLELCDRSEHLHNHQHRLQEESRGNIDRKTRIEQENQIERRKQVDDGNSRDHHVPHRKVLHEGGHKYHEPEGAKGQRQTLEQGICLGRKTNQDVEHFKKVEESNKRQLHELGIILDRPKRADRTNLLESCKYSEHYGQYERNGHNGRRGRTQNGKFL